MDTSHIRIELVAAVASNGVIGRDGDLPWRISEDLENFARLTRNGVCVVGRKTYESLPPLPSRTLVVCSNDGLRVIKRDHNAEIVTNEWLGEQFGSVQSALDVARKIATTRYMSRIFVIGGESIYTATLPLARSLHITHVHDTPRGDTHFPQFDTREWDIYPQFNSETHSRVLYMRQQDHADAAP